MNLTFKRREVKNLQHLGALVAENAEAIEPGLQILASNFNLGRTTIELAAIDTAQAPVLITLGLTADDAMLIRALEAYAWCLEYPESLQRLVPATVQPGCPPRVVFVAERLLESFVRKMRLLKFSTVDCFEFRYVEANGTTGFYLDRVDWAPLSAVFPETIAAKRPERVEHPIVEQPIVPREDPKVVPREEPKIVPREGPKVVVLREEPKVAAREEPKVVPLEEPRIVMLHESKAAPRIVEPAATNGSLGNDSTQGSERPPVILKGLRPPAENSPRRKPREVPDSLRAPAEERTPAPRDVGKTPAPPAAARASNVEPKPAPAADPRVMLQGLDLNAKGGLAKSDLAKNGVAKNDLPQSDNDVARGDAPKGDAAKGDLAPTWRKFLDKLTSTFDARPAPQPQPGTPRASVPPAATPPPLAIQPFAAEIEVAHHDVAPDEIQDESHDPVGELTEKQRSLFQGLTLPDNGELAPQWRKFLDHPALDEVKIAVVRGYLQREFPLCTVYDFYDFQRNSQVFQLQDDHGKVTQLITMTAEFFDSHRDLEIRAWIEKHRLAQAMRQAGQAGVLVSQAGLQIERR